MPKYVAIAELTTTRDFYAYCARVKVFFEQTKWMSIHGWTFCFHPSARRLTSASRQDFESAVDSAENLYYDRQPSALHERFVFWKTRQAAGESVRDFAARIEKGARFCKLKAGLLTDKHEEALRDQFVFGLRARRISGPNSFERKQRHCL